MNNQKPSLLKDSWIMVKRSLLISSRNMEAVAMAIIQPFLMMILFSAIFGGIADMGDIGINYLDFIVSGIILQSVAQGTQFTSLSVSTDMTRGIIDRFRSMPISNAAVLIGHATASVVKNSITAAITLGTAILVGFRPQAGFMDWLIVIGIFMLFIVAITWISILVGLLAKAPESTIGYMLPFFILPFLSSGFAPTETLHRALRWFAQNQPMTPIIDSTRALMLGWPTGNSIWLAVAWCVGITVVAFAAAVQVYKRKMI